MDESAMLRRLIDMILNNTCLNYEHKDLRNMWMMWKMKSSQ